ncbi:MAG TPA: hypothetical protein VMV81_09935, partial [Phycisphaerae bacterium]|nr:hypothetical protein [Phycisphaerae bacterium]
MHNHHQLTNMTGTPTRPLHILAGILVLLGMATVAGAQPTAFTYQGQLKDGGSPASGSFDMVFRLFDSDLKGNQVGADVPLSGVSVAAGLFTAQVDFGAVFTGGPLWLEVQVSGDILSPRQSLTSTPYAQRASDAQTCVTAQSSSTANYAYGPWVPSGADLYYNDGNVGIGTSTPTAKLEIVGTPGVDGIKFPDGTLQLSASAGGAGPWGSNGADIYYNAGKVGIGTNTPSSPLDIQAIGDGAEVLRLSTERPWVFRQSATGSVTRLQLKPLSGLKNFDITANLGGPCATFFADDTNPAVGIGTNLPQSRLDVAATGAGAQLLRLSTERPWIFRQTLTGPSTGLELYSTSGQKQFQITAVSGTPVATFVADDAAPQLIVNGTTRTKVLQIMGADMAEKFPISDGKAEPGTVMEIDPDHAGKLRISRGAYNPRVAGVVSGAGDIPVGVILGNLPGQDDAPSIALSGRV